VNASDEVKTMSILTTGGLTHGVGELKAVNDLSAPPSVTIANDRKPILVVSNLSKGFGKVTAVDAINFEVFEGELFGLVGWEDNDDVNGVIASKS
jgi:ABC-type glutathione transport system ATPase component